MTFKARRIVKLLYIIMTVMAVAVLFYTADYYFRIYRATHALSVEIHGFDISLLNVTHAQTETNVTIQNPSEFQFEVVYVEERLSSDPSDAESFILHGLTWFSIPKPIQPASSLTVTVIETVRVEKIETAPMVFAEIAVLFHGPLVEEFLMQSYGIVR